MNTLTKKKTKNHQIKQLELFYKERNYDEATVFLVSELLLGSEKTFDCEFEREKFIEKYHRYELEPGLYILANELYHEIKPHLKINAIHRVQAILANASRDNQIFHFKESLIEMLAAYFNLIYAEETNNETLMKETC